MQLFIASDIARLALDLALAIFIVVTTSAVLWNWRRIRRAGGAQGTVLIGLGLWGISSLHFYDLYVALAGQGEPGTRAKFGDHSLLAGLGWHFDVASALLVAIGLFALVRKVIVQYETQAGLLAEVEQRESRLNDAARMARLGFYIYDSRAEKILFCTEQHAASHGLGVEDYLQRASTLTNDMPLIHPDDRDMVRQKYLEVRAGKTVELEYRVPTPEGERWVREITTPVFDDAGEVVREIGTSQDVTEQHEMQTLLQQSVKMEAIGNLTGGIAHDFNNLLAVILGNLELAKERPEDYQSLLDEALVATLRGAELTKSMLSFARRAPLEPSVLDLNRIVRDTKNWAARALPPVIEIETSLLAGLWPIKADRASTESALLNLILNARDAMAGGGKLTLETANVRIDKDYVEDRHEDMLTGRYVMLAVSDTGIGIAQDIRDRIFEPFFSTKGPGKGSGLGLSMIQGFMKQSGGTVRVYSEPGEGTTFKLYFRAVMQRAEPPKPVATGAKGAVVDSGYVILLAEDEAGVRTVIERALREAGHAVISAPSGDTALALFAEAEKVDLVLTDIVMPGRLQGPELVRVLRAHNASLPAVFMSGYANEATVHGNGLRPEDIRLMKPITRRALLEAVEQALATPPSS